MASYFRSNGISDCICNLFSSLKSLMFSPGARRDNLSEKAERINFATCWWLLQSDTPLKLLSGSAEVTTVGTFVPTLSY